MTSGSSRRMVPVAERVFSPCEINQVYHAAMVAANRGHSYQASVLIDMADREDKHHPADTSYRWKERAKSTLRSL